MQNLKKYKSLIKDTITYLENFENDFIISKNSFFKTTEKKILIKPKQNVKDLKAQPIQKKSLFFKNKEKIETIKISENINEKKILQETSKKNNKNIQSNIVENKKIKIEEKPKIIEDNFNDIKNIISKISKNIPITDKILDDKLAKQKSQKYKLKNIAAKLTILAYKENEKHFKFLEKVSIALDNYFYPSKIISAYIIEKENNWNTFLLENEILLIISSESTIFELPNLRKRFKEIPITKEKFLDDIPLFLISDILLYLKEPSLKALLFKNLQQKITNLKT